MAPSQRTILQALIGVGTGAIVGGLLTLLAVPLLRLDMAAELAAHRGAGWIILMGLLSLGVAAAARRTHNTLEGSDE